MILGNLNYLNRYFDQHHLFEKANDFLVNTDFSKLENGKHEIDSDNIFAIISRNGDSEAEDPKMESHKKYLDIHYVVEGSDTIGWKSINDCKGSIGSFNVEDDYILYKEHDYMMIKLSKNDFLIVYPEDVHAPLLVTKELFKVVLKIKV